MLQRQSDAKPLLCKARIARSMAQRKRLLLVGLSLALLLIAMVG